MLGFSHLAILGQWDSDRCKRGPSQLYSEVHWLDHTPMENQQEKNACEHEKEDFRQLCNSKFDDWLQLKRSL